MESSEKSDARRAMLLRSLCVTIAVAIVLAFVYVVSALALIARNDPLWLDELHTRWVIDSEWTQVVDRSSIGNQTPLYFYFVRLLTTLVGNEAFELRWTSIFAMVAGGVLAAGFVWHKTRSVSSSALTSVLWCGSGWFVYYGSEARPYALLILVSLLQLIHFCRLLELVKEVERRYLWVASGLLLMLTVILVGIHPTAVFLIAAETVALAMIAVFGCVSHAPRLQELRRTKVDLIRFHLLPAAGLGLGGAVGALFLLPLGGTVANRKLWDSFSNSSELIQGFLWASAPIVLSILVVVVSKRNREQFAGRLALLIAVLMVCVAIGLDLFGVPVANQRYTVFAFALLPIVAGLMTSNIQNVGVRGVTCCGAMLIGLTVPTTSWLPISIYKHQVDQIRREDWQAAINECQSIDDPDLIFLLGNVLEDAALDTAEPTVDSKRLIEYLKFPLVGSGGQTISKRVNPVSTWSTSRCQSIVDELARSQSNAFVVVRMDVEGFNQFTTELNSKLRVAFGAKCNLQNRLPHSEIVHVLSIQWKK